MTTVASDVFLSYNSADVRPVKALAERLEALGVRTWFDHWKLVPGTPWQATLERGVDEAKSCAVIVGKKGLGPWQTEEMRAAIQRRISTNHQFRVIPVLLPGGARPKRELPAFLQNTHWVRISRNLDDGDGLHRLLCGIRGLEPGPTGERAAERQRVQWEIKLSTTIESLDEPATQRLIKHLQTISGDGTLLIKKKMVGSVILVIEGEPAGFEAIVRFFAAGYLSELAGFKVETVKLEAPAEVLMAGRTKSAAVPERPRKAARKPNAAFMKPVTRSAMDAVLGTEIGKPMPRTEVTRRLWAYIKKNGLQDAKDKRMLRANDQLKLLFGGRAKVSIDEVVSLLNKRRTQDS